MAHNTTLVIDLILKRIDQGDYLPGQTLDEQSIAAELNVSRTPVREAFIRLESDGLITRGGRRGAQLFCPTTDEFLQILEVHAQLESQAASLAARRVTPEQLAGLDQNIAASEAHLVLHGDTNHAEYYQLNLQFHEILLKAAANPYLGKMVRTQARTLMSYYRNRYRFSGSTEASVAEHREIVALIRSGNAEEARAAMIRHFDYGLETVMDLLASAS